MNKKCFLLIPAMALTCFSCQKQNPYTQPEENALHFCESFYNLNYTVAKEWSTSSSLPYLSFLASNTTQIHLDKLKAHGAAKASLLTSRPISPDADTAIVICQIENAYILHPVNGKVEQITSLRDTLHLIKENRKWAVKMDIPQQNGKQNRD